MVSLHRRGILALMVLAGCPFDPTMIDPQGSSSSSGASDPSAPTDPSSSSASTMPSSSTVDPTLDDGESTAPADSSSAGTSGDPSATSSEGSTTGGPSTCPDGVVDDDETCDDDNDVDADGCTDCNVDAGWACAGSPSFCGQICDPLLQDCAMGQGCYVAKDSWICADDASGGTGVQNDSCDFINSCDPGLICVDGMALVDCAAVGCCTAICDLTQMPDTCPTGLDCIPVYGAGMAPPGYEDVGLCTLPS